MNSRIGLREQLILRYLFGVICNGIRCDCKNINHYGDECDCGVLLSPPPHPIMFYLIRIDIRLCENFVIECVFNVVCNGINSKNFCTNENDYGVLSTPAPLATRPYFNGIGNGLPEFNVYLCENNVINEICNDIIKIPFGM